MNKAHSQGTTFCNYWPHIVDIADVIQFYFSFRFNFEVCFVYYFHIVERNSFTYFTTFPNVAHSRATLFFVKFEKILQRKSCLYWILSNLKSIYPLFYWAFLSNTYIWALCGMNQKTCLYWFLPLLYNRKSTAFLWVSKNSENNSQTARFVFVMLGYVTFLSSSLQKLMDLLVV